MGIFIFVSVFKTPRTAVTARFSLSKASAVMIKVLPSAPLPYRPRNRRVGAGCLAASSPYDTRSSIVLSRPNIYRFPLAFIDVLSEMRIHQVYHFLSEKAQFSKNRRGKRE